MKQSNHHCKCGWTVLDIGWELITQTGRRTGNWGNNDTSNSGKLPRSRRASNETMSLGVPDDLGALPLLSLPPPLPLPPPFAVVVPEVLAEAEVVEVAPGEFVWEVCAEDACLPARINACCVALLLWFLLVCALARASWGGCGGGGTPG